MIAGSSLRAKLCLAAGPLSYPYGFGSVWWELSAVWLQARCRTGTGSLQYGCGLCCLAVGSVPYGYGLGVFCLRPWRCMVAGSVLYGYWLHGVCPRVVMQSDGCGFVGCAPSDVRLRLRFCSMLAELSLHGREVSKVRLQKQIQIWKWAFWYLCARDQYLCLRIKYKHLCHPEICM